VPGVQDPRLPDGCDASISRLWHYAVAATPRARRVCREEGFARNMRERVRAAARPDAAFDATRSASDITPMRRLSRFTTGSRRTHHSPIFYATSSALSSSKQ
jgi:hypothetical protein